MDRFTTPPPSRPDGSRLRARTVNELGAPVASCNPNSYLGGTPWRIEALGTLSVRRGVAAFRTIDRRSAIAAITFESLLEGFNYPLLLVGSKSKYPRNEQPIRFVDAPVFAKIA
jgi:hypothetical protein